MRIHRLEVTAFGPFSGTEAIDFDDLSDAGLFLLCGPTGAGKTSILDAICFGLYGDVPGDRNSAKQLHSHHAPAGVAPQVDLEVTLNGRRFRIRRSPAWVRPKHRGTGSTTESARVTLEESVARVWVHLSSRLDETGHLVAELMGMNVAQFCQVAMLPQGEFQAFLRARSDDRHRVLQQLFRTSRFEDVEKWLVGHRLALKGANRAHQDAVSSVVSRLSEASASPLRDSWDLHDLARPAETGEVTGWAEELVSSSARDGSLVTAELKRVTGELEEARRARDSAVEIASLRQRHAEAKTAHQRLDDESAQAAEDRSRLDAARRAAGVVPVLRLSEEHRDSAEAAQSELATALADAAARLKADTADLTSEAIVLAEQEARDTATVARALLPREAELRSARTRRDEASRELGELSAVAADLDARCRALPGRLARLRTEAADHTAAAAAGDGIEKALQQVHIALESAERVVRLRSEIEAARLELSASVDVAQSLRESMHEVRERRITGMAAELASALASGESCPVCGSAEHPARARAVDGAPTQADEDRAREDYETADFTRQAHAEALTTLQRNLAVAEQVAGGKDARALADDLARLTRERESARAAKTEQERLTQDIRATEVDLARVQERAIEVRAEQARLEHEREHARTVVDKVSKELSALVAEGEVAESVQQLIDENTAASSVFSAARAALAARDNAARKAGETERRALETALSHGFDRPAEAADAALRPDEAAALDERLRGREALEAQVAAVLADEAVAAAVAAGPQDVDVLERRVTALEKEHTTLGGRAQVAESRAGRLGLLHSELAAELSAWAPTRAAYAVAQSLSTFVEGKGADNALQMRLSAYVLAARLGQVVAAANERLGAMSDERYTLEHSASRGVGESRGGLSLLVRDEWTGAARDPATLSGGETFVTSLALALGLADVVAHEAGGADIETLFVDEGFGTLDPETLDDVMDTLDGLRDGGRVVGIVSHVPEMRTRITTQLQIRKDRTGSHVRATRVAV